MKDATPEATTDAEAAPAKKKRGLLLPMLLAVPVLLAAGGGAAYVFLPGVAQTVHAMLPGGHAAEPKAQAAAAGNRPVFVDLPEMAVTLPNGGHARQLRIRMSLELAKTTSVVPTSEFLTPRLYDSLLTYLRTLRESEIEGGLSIDRMRADLYRRTDLMLGSGIVQDVLITSLVVG